MSDELVHLIRDGAALHAFPDVTDAGGWTLDPAHATCPVCIEAAAEREDEETPC